MVWGVFAPSKDMQADALEGIRQGRDDVKNGRTQDARAALTAFRRDRGVAR